MSTKYYQCPECGRVNKSDAVLDRGFKRVCSTHPNGIVHAWTDMIPVQVIPETPEPQPWDEIARTLGYEDRHDMQGALAACASYLRYPIAGVEHQHPNQLADELDKAVKAMETPKIPFHTVNPEEPYDGDLVWTADGRAWAFYAAKHGWNRAPERDRKPTPETPEPLENPCGPIADAYDELHEALKKFHKAIGHRPVFLPAPEPIRVEFSRYSDDEKIERMARALFETNPKTTRWAEAMASVKECWRDHAKAALAALETLATPKLPEGVTILDGFELPRPGELLVGTNYGADLIYLFEYPANETKRSVRVSAEYILNKIQEDIENA